MQDAAVAAPSGMVAIMGADHDAVADLCRAAADGDVLVPANYNAPGQIVISGTAAACARAVSAADASGFKATALKVAGAFHSPLMQPAADRLRADLDRIPFEPARVPVYSNVTGQPHALSPLSIKQRLVEQICTPVQWEQIMVALVSSAGSAQFAELAPGKTLAGLARRINRRLVVRSLDVAAVATGVAGA
jgi:[acyl-carrier-protein] S-malonyltransferase